MPDPMPTGTPPPDKKWVWNQEANEGSGAWEQQPNLDYAGLGKTIKVNGVDTHFDDPNIQYVNGSSEDPKMYRRPARQNVTGGNTEAAPVFSFRTANAEASAAAPVSWTNWLPKMLRRPGKDTSTGSPRNKNSKGTYNI